MWRCLATPHIFKAQEQKCTERLSGLVLRAIRERGSGFLVKGGDVGFRRDRRFLSLHLPPPPRPKITGHLIPDVTLGLMHHRYVLTPSDTQQCVCWNAAEDICQADRETERIVDDKDRLNTHYTHTVTFLNYVAPVSLVRKGLFWHPIVFF